MEELIKYFCNLLIIQYRNKRKAKGTIEALTKTLFEDVNGEVFLLKYQNAFDLDTAELEQLKTISKYIGYSDTLGSLKTNYFRFSDDNEDVTPGLSDYSGTNIGYPMLDYSGYSYVENSLSGVAGITLFRKTLGFLTEMKNEILSAGNIDRLLDKYFDGDLYVEEGDKSITYFYSDELLYSFGEDLTLLESFIKKFMPKPMGCSLVIDKAPYRLNAIPFGGAEVDENFIFKMETVDEEKYFETPEDIHFTQNDIFEICVKVKVNSDYELSGFCQTKDPLERFSLLKRRIDHTYSVSAFGYIYPILDYTDYTDDWAEIIITKNPSFYPGMLGKVIFNGQVVAENVEIPVIFYYDGKMQFGIGNFSGISTYGLIGELDFKGCYIKKNNVYVWRGITNRR